MPSLNLIHRTRQPASGTAPYPALLMVHGWLGDENSMWAFSTALPTNAFIVSVRAPFATENGFGWTLPGEADSFERGLAALHEFVNQFPAQYSVDPNAITLMGFSQGAAMCYALTLQHPELVHATAALAGFLPEQARPWATPNRLQGKPVFIAHGTEDPTVSVEEARKARDVLAGCGANITYHESSSAHKLSAQAMRDLKAWLSTATGNSA